MSANWRDVLTDERRKELREHHAASLARDPEARHAAGAPCQDADLRVLALAALDAADEADASAELLKPLPCGHPAVCAKDGVCWWCADVGEKEAVVLQLEEALEARDALVEQLADDLSRAHIEIHSLKKDLDAFSQCEGGNLP